MCVGTKYPFRCSTMSSRNLRYSVGKPKVKSVDTTAVSLRRSEVGIRYLDDRFHSKKRTEGSVLSWLKGSVAGKPLGWGSKSLAVEGMVEGNEGEGYTCVFCFGFVRMACVG